MWEHNVADGVRNLMPEDLPDLRWRQTLPVSPVRADLNQTVVTVPEPKASSLLGQARPDLDLVGQVEDLKRPRDSEGGSGHS